MKLTNDELLQVFKILFQSTMVMNLNANDTFNYSTADSVSFDPDDIRWASPIIHQYGYDGINAIMAHIREQHVIKEMQTEKYMEAYNKITDLNPEIYSKEANDSHS
jgi:hypothetical protein